MTPAFKVVSAPSAGTTYHIYVEPPQTDETNARLPVVLFLDGDDQFAHARDAYRKMRSDRSVRPLLLVGVGYGASYTRPGNRRGRDYTPVAHSDEPTSGGADAFLSFLIGTLWPELERRYPVDRGRRAIAGHSLGSLLVLHALFQKQPFFTDHLASAPSLWWADRAMLTQVRRLRDEQGELAARLFLSVGAEDSASMTSDLDLLEKQLTERPFSGLRVEVRRFPGRNHYDVLTDAFGAGLVWLFGT